MIEVKDLWKSFGKARALRGVSFQVASGTIAGFLGPNGAGKTTAMRVLTTFLPPESGLARICGFDVSRDPGEVCRRVGYLPEQVALYPEMRVLEYLRFRAALKGLSARSARARVSELLAECALTGVARKLLGALSKGYRQRVGLADVLLGDPEVLILDEPTSGLDPRQVVEVRRLIESFRGRRTVLLSSHILGEVEQVCDQVVIIAGGEIRANESRAGWQKRLERAGGVRVAFAGPAPPTAAQELGRIDGVIDVKRSGDVFAVRARGDIGREVFRWAAKNGHDLVELSPIEATLETLFLRVTADEGSDG